MNTQSDDSTASEPMMKKRRISDNEAGSSDDDMAKSEAKREYNRLNAARNRARQKQLLTDLKEQAKAGTEKMDKLERENEILKVQVAALKEQNELLVRSQQPQQQQQQPSNQIPPALLQQLPPQAAALFQNASALEALLALKMQGRI